MNPTRPSIPVAVVCALALHISTGPAAPVVEVRNGPNMRFRPTVTWNLTPGEAADSKTSTAVVTYAAGRRPERALVAVDTTGETPVAVCLLPGILDPGTVAVIRPEPDTGAGAGAAAVSDLQTRVTEDDIVIRNTYFEVRHPRRGAGGFPRDVEFRLSGNRDSALQFLDRIFLRETRTAYRGDSDPESTAEVVLDTPVRVVVETRFRYLNGALPAPGNPRAVYRYVYSAFTPVVAVDARVEKDDDTQFDEIHFLHPSREDAHYDAFVTGEPPEVHPMLPPGAKSRHLAGSHWAVMATAADAVGVGFDGAGCWDAADEFVYYVRNRVENLTERTRLYRGGLYFGPAWGEPGEYSRFLGPHRNPETRRMDEPDAEKAPERIPDDAVRIANAAMEIVFAAPADGFGCLLIRGQDEFLGNRPEEAGLWSLRFSAPGGENAPPEEVTLDNRAAAACEARRETPDGRPRLLLTWRGIDLPGEEDAVDVTVSVDMENDAPASEWRIEVANRSARFGLKETTFPVLRSIVPDTDAAALLPMGNWGGRLFRDRIPAVRLPYPSAACPVQFMAVNRGNRGIYLAAHDGGARPKTLILDGGGDAAIGVPAEDAGVPGAAGSPPFPVSVQLYDGDWWTAARLYRTWALKQAWTAKGPLIGRPDLLRGFTELGFWMLASGTPEAVAAVMARADSLADVPVGVHWYNWHVIPFDHTYPEYFPAKDGFADAVKRMTAQGMTIMPYINGRLWDRDIDSFAETGIAGACKQENGQPYTEMYGSGRRLAPMCPATELWQQRVREICTRLVDECGVNAIYIDQIGAAAPQLCFDPNHGHPLGGGRHWVDGYRTMLTPIREMCVSKGVALTTENTAEPYMDTIDGFLTWLQREENDVPLLPAIYSGYTVYFSSPQARDDDVAAFCAAQGRDFIWGCQEGWNDAWILDPENAPKRDFQLRLCGLRLAAADFMIYGTLVGEVRPVTPPPPISVVWNRNNPHTAMLNSVAGTWWVDAAGREAAATLVNSADVTREFEFITDAARNALGTADNGKLLMSRLTPAGRAPESLVDAGVPVRILLPPRTARILVFTPATDTPGSIAEAERHLNSPDPELADAAAAFRFENDLRAKGIDLRPGPRICTVAAGEPAEFLFTLQAAGRTDARLQFAYPDGTTADAVPDRTPRAIRHMAWPPPAGATAVTVRVPDGPSRTVAFEVRHVPAVTVALSLPEGIRGGETFLLPLEIRNNSRSNRSGRVVLRLPQGWQAEPGGDIPVADLLTGEARATAVVCRVPPMRADKRETVTAMYTESAVGAQVPVRASRPVWTIPALAAPPAIDGNPDDWAAFPAEAAVTPGIVRIDENYGGDADCSATIRMAWDDAFVYVLAEVLDDIHQPAEAGADMWHGDCIQLAFVPGPAPRGPGYSGREVEIGLAEGPDGPEVYSWMPSPGPVANARMAVVREGGITRYEAAIPRNRLGISDTVPTAALYGSLTVNDNDGTGFEGWIEWTPGICGDKDASQFGLLRLKP